MDDDFDLRFSVRYAIKVLELQARAFRRIDYTVKAFGLHSGTAAFAAIVNNHPVLTLCIGVVLALAQVVDFVLRPAERAAEASFAAKPYRKLLGDMISMGRQEAEQRLEAIKAEDEVQPFETLREAAFNLITLEMGGNRDYLIRLHRGVIGRLAGVPAN